MTFLHDAAHAASLALNLQPSPTYASSVHDLGLKFCAWPPGHPGQATENSRKAISSDPG